jgi:hypothetical protein
MSRRRPARRQRAAFTRALGLGVEHAAVKTGPFDHHSSPITSSRRGASAPRATYEPQRSSRALARGVQ